MPLAPNQGFLFRGLVVPGMVLRGVERSSHAIQIYRTHFWGLNGESQITGDLGGRDLRFTMVLFSSARFNSRLKLWQYLENDLHNELLATGPLELPFDEVYQAATLQAIYQQSGILPDLPGTFGGGYFAFVGFEFRDLGGT